MIPLLKDQDNPLKTLASSSGRYIGSEMGQFENDGELLFIILLYYCTGFVPKPVSPKNCAPVILLLLGPIPFAASTAE